MKKVSIVYFVHGTTTDNEKEVASGWNDAPLSELGIKQSAELQNNVKGKKFDAVFCSDLKRATDAAIITFGSGMPIIQDPRLRECNYGNLNGKNSKVVEAEVAKHIAVPFPKGESYKDVEARMRNFLKDLEQNYSGKTVAIVGHKATQLALEVIINGKSWKQAIEQDWRLKEPKEWKPGWVYTLKSNV